MDGNHPNRKKDKSNPYTLSVENNTYYISFTDGQGIFINRKSAWNSMLPLMVLS